MLDRRNRFLRMMVALVVLLAALGLGSETRGGSEPQAPEAEGQTFAISGSSRIVSDAERLFEAVDPRRDGWVSEVVADELDAVLHELGDAFAHGDAVRMRAVLHRDFRGSPPSPESAEPMPGLPGASLERRHFSGAALADGDELVEGLLSWRAALGTVSSSKLKIVSIETDGPVPGREVEAARARILYELRGAGESGALRSMRGSWSTDWTRSAEGWRLSGIQMGPAEVAHSEAPFFVDVSASVLGRNDSYWGQMRVGIDEFRASVDAASGIDLYGHSGVSVADADGDGLEDLFVAQPQALPNRLYRNRGDGTFEDVSAEAGVDLLERTSVGLFGDFDNDGDSDLLVVVQNGDALLLENDGRGRFSLSEEARFERTDSVAATLSSASVADYDNDGFLDVYVTSYRYFDAPGEDTSLALPYPYHDARNGPPNVLFRNRGDGSFEDVTTRAGLQAGNDRFSFSSAWADFDGDGLLDLYVANDFGTNNLYHNLGGGRFEEVTEAAGVADVGAGMSVAWADYDLDGREDLYVGNMWSSAGQRLTAQPDYQPESVRASYVRHTKGNTLFRNRGDGTFEDVGAEAGAELGRWAWSSDFFDLDNDGDEDIYVANGFITNSSTRDL